ncbi:hypothetical protein BH11CYA1_BH11CYA1_00650 [soil metagenome]
MPDSSKEHHPNKGQKHSHQGPAHENKSAQSNTAENATLAAQTARAVLSTVQAGKVWNHTAPKGEREIKGSLDFQGQPLLMLRFSPADGSLLPKGLHGLNQSTPETMAIVQAKLPQIASQLVVLDGAEFREPECCWAIPVAHLGRIVAHLKVSADGTEAILDHKAAEELRDS